jgi:HEAT repeat protein
MGPFGDGDQGAISDLFALARSENYEDRVQAGRALSLVAEESGVYEVLVHLLLDADDTAVIQETADALLKRRTPAAIRPYLAARANARGEDEDHLYSALSGAFFDLSSDIDGKCGFSEMVSLFLVDEDERVRTGASIVLEEIRGAQ